MKASHDSLTGYPLRKWYLYPLNWMAKTQSKLLPEQLNSGVRYFDLRFRHVYGELYAAHGVLTYKITAKKVIEILNDYCNNTNEKIYFRVLLEDGIFKDDIPLSTFKFRINQLLKGCSNNLIFHRCGLKSDWSSHTLYCKVDFFGWNKFGLNREDIEDKIRQMDHTSIAIKSGEYKEPYVFECYTYKGFPFPWLSNRLIRKHIPDDSMRNFI